MMLCLTWHLNEPLLTEADGAVMHPQNVFTLCTLTCCIIPLQFFSSILQNVLLSVLFRGDNQFQLHIFRLYRTEYTIMLN